MAEGKLYFAYGSNINLDQMAQRCPDAQVVGPVTLENYELLFRGNLRGAGVATIAPREGSTVHGLLWNITPECERSLDYYEGYPHLYGKEPVLKQSTHSRSRWRLSQTRRAKSWACPSTAPCQMSVESRMTSSAGHFLWPGWVRRTLFP